MARHDDVDVPPVVALSPSRVQVASYRDIPRAHAVAFEFCCDPRAEAARTLGIEHLNALPIGMGALGHESDSVLPTVVILDRAGKVRWVHKTDNYRVRPEPALFLDILRTIDATPASKTAPAV